MAVPEGYISLGFVGFTDKGEFSPDIVYAKNDVVHKDNAIWKCLVDDTVGIAPVEGGGNWEIFIQSQTKANGITVTDTFGVVGDTGEVVVAQTFLDSLADKVMNQVLNLSTKMSIINLFDTGEYSINIEYTPKHNPRDFTYFVPIINWSACSIEIKGWHDDIYDGIDCFNMFPGDNEVSLIYMMFLINRSNGNIKISKINQIILSDGGNRYISHEKMAGVSIYGVKS